MEAAGLSPPVHGVVHWVVKGFIDALAKYGETYDPEDDGYTILIEDGHEDAVAADVCYPLGQAPLIGGYANRISAR